MESGKEKLFGATYSNRQLFGGFWRLAKPYWFSEERWAARGMLALIVVLNLGWVYLMVWLNQWYQKFYDAMQKLDEAAFWDLMKQFGLLAGIAIFVGVYRQFFLQILQNRWRKWMTRRFLEHWLREKSHYLWQLTEKKTDNPDQRIAEDVRDFVNNSLSLSVGLLNQTVTLFSFIAILWKLSGPLPLPLWGGHSLSLPGYMAWVCLVYAFVATWITHRIGRPLIPLNFRQQLVEANFRFSLVRLRENGESVALSEGEKVEEESLKGHFGWVYANMRSIIGKQMHLGFFTWGYDQLASVFPFIVAAPRFFSKQIALGGLMQISNAFGKVKDALSWVVDNYVVLAYWRSVVERLEGFEGEVERTKQMYAQARSVIRTAPSQDSLRLEQVSLSLPGNSTPLTRPLDIEFKKGQSILISGPSGCGKSTLLRALYGIWPFTRGRITLPDKAEVMVMPQKPYLPVGTLKAAFTYPKDESEIADSDVLNVLTLCRLDHLKDRLAQPDNWALILSVGEQQRVAWARVFLQKPQWIFLDEATSALDEDAQERLYRALKEQLPGTTMISVAHRQNPAEHHQQIWDILSGGDPHPV
jgi:putative ATP-binding cassette transporter